MSYVKRASLQRVYGFSLVVIAMLMLAGHATAATGDNDGRVSLREFADYAIDVGGEQEDWQPAFQAALEAALDRQAPLYVPPGKYIIRKAIEISHGGKLKQFLNPQNVAIIGASPDHSIIQQVNEEENAINWSGPTYKDSLSGGSIRDIAVVGGNVTLNIKWHNYFEMRNCYISAAQTYGIHAEGWSSQFRNSTVRWCRQAGIYGAAHFNNVTIEGFYFSRNGRAIHLVGGNGVYISDSGFESNASTAIFIQNISKPVITSCYFEGNGHDRGPDILDVGAGYPSSIHLDGLTNSVVIENNIFRGGQGYNSASQINIAACEGARIRDNLFSNCLFAIKLLEKSHTAQKQIGPIKALKVTDNTIETRANVWKLRGTPSEFLAEETPGLIERTVANGTTFEQPVEITRKRAVENE